MNRLSRVLISLFILCLSATGLSQEQTGLRPVLQTYRPTNSLKPSQRGKLFATVDEGFVAIWRSKDGAILGRVQMGDSIEGFDFSSDERLFFCRTGDTTRWWKLENLKEVATVPHEALESMSLSPLGTILISRNNSETRFLDASTGEQELVIRDTLVEFSSHEDYMVTGNKAPFLNLWDTRTWEPVANITGSSSAIVAAKFDQTGQYLATLDESGYTRTWSIPEGKMIAEAQTGDSYFMDLAWSKIDTGLISIGDGVTIFRDQALSSPVIIGEAESAHWHPELRRLAVTTSNTLSILGYDGAELWKFSRPEAKISQIEWHPTLPYLIVVWDDLFQVFDENGRVLQELQDLQRADWTPDGRLLLLNDDKELSLLDPRDSTTSLVQPGGHWEYTLDFHPETDDLYSVGYSGEIHSWGRKPSFVNLDEIVVDLDWNNSGILLATAGVKGQIKLTKRNAKEASQSWQAHESRVDTLAWHPNGSQLASGGQDNLLKTWSAEGESLEKIEFPGYVLDVEYSPSGELLAVACSDFKSRLLTPEMKVAATLEGHEDWVTENTWNPAGTQVATASLDSSVRTWSKDGTQLKELRGHVGWVYDVAYSPDGATIASCGRDHTVRLWDATSGEMKAVLEGHQDFVTSVGWTKDGQRLASCGRDGSIRIWNPETFDQIGILAAAGKEWVACDGAKWFGSDRALRKFPFRNSEGFLVPVDELESLRDQAILKSILP